MNGLGILRGLAVTLRHFVLTVTSGDMARQRAGAPTVRPEASDTHGVFTVQYPEQKLAVPERFRSFPILLYEDETGQDRCTSCGICAKVCPPQCIWIVRSAGPDGKPIPQPAEFIIDTSICMSCGLCAEYCPFNAIKMDHEYELATAERHRTLLLAQGRAQPARLLPRSNPPHRLRGRGGGAPGKGRGRPRQGSRQSRSDRQVRLSVSALRPASNAQFSAPARLTVKRPRERVDRRGRPLRLSGPSVLLSCQAYCDTSNHLPSRGQ